MSNSVQLMLLHAQILVERDSLNVKNGAWLTVMQIERKTEGEHLHRRWLNEYDEWRGSEIRLCTKGRP